MIPAVDSYSYHRFFGHCYAGLEQDPGWRMSVGEFLDRVEAMGASGVSLESCFFDDFSKDAIDALRDDLDRRGLQRVWAWGHPRGLESGASEAALDDLVAHVGVAARLGASVMRICAGGRGTRPERWADHRAALLPMLSRAARAAKAAGVVLALENHLDLYADEMLDLLGAVGSPWLGVCLDTANNLRLAEDPVEVARKLAPFAHATHLKDIAPAQGGTNSFTAWPSVPLGRGAVDVAAILELLRSAGYAGLLAVEIDLLHPDHASEDEAVAASLAWLRAKTGAA